MKRLGLLILACLTLGLLWACQTSRSSVNTSDSSQDLALIPGMEEVDKWPEFLQIQTQGQASSQADLDKLLGPASQNSEENGQEVLTWKLAKHLEIHVRLKEGRAVEKELIFEHTRGTCMLFPGIKDGTAISEAFEKTGQPYAIKESQGQITCSWYMAGTFRYLQLREGKVYNLDQ